MTCKCTDCIHYNVCQDYDNRVTLDIYNMAEKCKYFKDKSNIFFFQSSFNFNNNEIYVIVKDNKGKYILCGVKSNYLSNIIFDDNNILISYDYLINKDKNNEETNQNKTIQWIAPYYEYSYSLDYKDFNETWFFDKELAIKELKRRNKNDL